MNGGIELPTWSIRFGTYGCKPDGNIRFTKDNVNVIVFQEPNWRRDEATLSITISYRHVNNVEFCIKDEAKQNFVIFSVSSVCADKLRTALGIRTKPSDVRPNEPYFDPKRPEECFRYIVVLLNGVEKRLRDEFVDLFINKVSVQKRESDEPFEFKEIEMHMAEKLLIRTVPNQLKLDTDKTTDSTNRKSPCLPISTTGTFNRRPSSLSQSEDKSQVHVNYSEMNGPIKHRSKSLIGSPSDRDYYLIPHLPPPPVVKQVPSSTLNVHAVEFTPKFTGHRSSAKETQTDLPCDEVLVKEILQDPTFIEIMMRVCPIVMQEYLLSRACCRGNLPKWVRGSNRGNTYIEKDLNTITCKSTQTDLTVQDELIEHILCNTDAFAYLLVNNKNILFLIAQI